MLSKEAKKTLQKGEVLSGVSFHSARGNFIGRPADVRLRKASKYLLFTAVAY